MVGFQVFRGVAGCIFGGPAKALSIYEWEIYHYFEKRTTINLHYPLWSSVWAIYTIMWFSFSILLSICVHDIDNHCCRLNFHVFFKPEFFLTSSKLV